MFCSACGNPLKLGAHFCSTCGTAANMDSATAAVTTLNSCRFCPGCGLVQSVDGRFCQHCSACSQCGVRRTPTHAPTTTSSVRTAPTGDRLAAIALDSVLIPYVMLYAIPFMPSMQVWWWTMLMLWCGNIVTGNISGQSLGKRVLHIRVVRAGSGTAPGLTRGLMRTAVYVLTGGPIGLGAMWALADEHGRGWHDLIAGTAVISDSRQQPATRLRGGPAGAALR
jgi:uncharacterized RDD family membrane protein YckC